MSILGKTRSLAKKVVNLLLTEKQRSEKLIKYLRENGAEIGSNVDLLTSDIDMGEPYLLKIGNNVTITKATILTHDACLKKSIGYSRVGEVHIGDNVFIGAESIILPCTHIGNNVIVGAGCVVAKDIPDDSIVVGNPCRIIGTFSDFLNKQKAEMKQFPCVDLYPLEILKSQDIRESLIKNGKGFVQ